MTHSNVKEFREENPTLNQTTFLSKNLDPLNDVLSECGGES
jgi:hypothetical protein